MSDAPAWILGAAVVLIVLGVLGFSVRSDAYLHGSLHTAMTPRPVDPEARARNWIAYRYRKWLLSGGLALLVAGIALALA